MPITDVSLEPALPGSHGPGLEDRACTVIQRAGQLQAMVRPPFMEELAAVTRMMHCYYSNLIEGQQTLVPDIEAALRNDFSAEPGETRPSETGNGAPGLPALGVGLHRVAF